MPFNDEVFKMVQDLAAARPFRADAVAAITTQPLQPASSQPNAYFTIYTAHDDANPHVKETELRVPKAGATADDGLLILTLPTTSCIAESEVKAHFGDKAEPSFPSPREPASAPMYLVYRLPWGALRFGFERGGRACLTTVVLDATRKGG
ncbi:MAG: hypothetical protein ABJE95_06155 [Byssovorax sp.]